MTEIDLGASSHTPQSSEDGAWKTWTLGAILTALLGLAGTWGASVQERIVSAERDSQLTRERLSNIEARADSIQRQIDANVIDLKEAVRRIDNKLDRIIEGDRNGYVNGARRFDR